MYPKELKSGVQTLVYTYSQQHYSQQPKGEDNVVYILQQLKKQKTNKKKCQLAQCVCVHARMLSHAQLFIIPWTAACQVSPSMGFPSQGDLPDTGAEPTSAASAGRFSTTETPGKPSTSLSCTLNIRKRKMEGVKRSLRFPAVST